MICRFSLAVTRPFKNQNGDYEADFISCVAFGKTADLVVEYLHKGDRIAVDGRIQTGSYTGGDGLKRYTNDVVVDRIEFLTQGNKRSQSFASVQPENRQEDIFADFGEEISIDDNFLD